MIYISRALLIYLTQEFSFTILQMSFAKFIFIFNLYSYSSVSAITNFKSKKEFGKSKRTQKYQDV